MHDFDHIGHSTLGNIDPDTNFYSLYQYEFDIIPITLRSLITKQKMFCS